METVYRAFDGKIFDCSDDCVLYEEKSKPRSFQIFDKDLNQIVEYNVHGYSNAFYIRVDTEEAVNEARDELGGNGFQDYGIGAPGLYHYNEALDEWDNCEALLDHYREKIDKITKALEKISGKNLRR